MGYDNPNALLVAGGKETSPLSRIRGLERLYEYSRFVRKFNVNESRKARPRKILKTLAITRFLT
jgi:hypothetical protein